MFRRMFAALFAAMVMLLFQAAPGEVQGQEYYQLNSSQTGEAWAAVVTNDEVDLTRNGVTDKYYRQPVYDVQGYRVYWNEQKSPPVIGFPNSRTGVMLAGSNAPDRSTYGSTDMVLTETGAAGGTGGSGGGAVPFARVGTAPPQTATPGVRRFTLSGGGYSGSAEQSPTGLSIIIGSGNAEVYQRAAGYDVPGFEAYANMTIGRIIRWPTAGTGTMSVGDLVSGSITWNSSPLQITAVTPGPVQSGPVVTGPVVPPGPPRLISSGEVPRPPLTQAILTLTNTHDKELLIRLTDFRNPVDSPEFRIPPRGQRTIYLDRDPGSDLVQVFEDSYGRRTERRTPHPPHRIYDISVYVMKQQSVAYGLNGEIEDATYVPQSVGKIEVPAGAVLQSGVSDIYNEALRRNNAGGVDRLRDPQWDR